MGACLHVCSVSVYVCVCPSVPCGGAIGAHGVPEGSLRWKGQGGPQGAREDPRGAQENLLTKEVQGLHGGSSRGAQGIARASKNEDALAPVCLRQGKVSSSDLIFTEFE